MKKCRKVNKEEKIDRNKKIFSDAYKRDASSNAKIYSRICSSFFSQVAFFFSDKTLILIIYKNQNIHACFTQFKIDFVDNNNFKICSENFCIIS